MEYNFDSIAGYAVEKEELKRLCEIFNNRTKYQKKGAKLPKGIIFYGESGTGKTLFTKVLANECNLEVLKINIADTVKDSDICKLIKSTFSKASKKKNPTMIFFDEIDKVLPNASEEYYTDRSKTVLAQLLTLIDGMDSTGNVIFVATCNYYGSLPETLVRPGRIDKKISIGLPNYSSRIEILKMYVKKTSCKFEMSIEDMAKLCGGFSCSALETLVNECILRSDENGFISEELIRSHFFEIKNEDIPRERSSVGDSILACRNLGHFVVAKAFNSGHYTLSLESDTVCNNFFDDVITLSDNDEDWDDDDDYDDDDYDDDDEDWDDDYEEEQKSMDEDDSNYEKSESDFIPLYSKVDYINAITVLLGGYVAEEIVLNKVYDHLDGILDSVDNILRKMFDAGMFGISLRYSSNRNEILPYRSEFINKINSIFEETITTCYEKAKAIIKKNVKLIENLSKILVEKAVIQDKEGEQLIEQFGGIKF